MIVGVRDDGAKLCPRTRARIHQVFIETHPMTDSISTEFPKEGRLAAIDFGTVRIGVAVCDPTWTLASPLETYQVAGESADAKHFRELVRQERVVGFVVGLPIHCDGKESQKSQESRAFARWLSEQTDCPVRLFDERFTTNAAKQRLSFGNLSRQKKKQRLDAVAALVLLESFLEATRYHGFTAGEPCEGSKTGGEALDDGGEALDDGDPKEN